LQEELAIMV